MSTKNLSLPWQLPEFLLMAAVIFYWVSTANALNPIAIGLLSVLFIQWRFSIRWMGIVIPSFLSLASSYMMLAVWSEYREFPEPSAEAYQLLGVGMGFFLSTWIVSGVMIYKYAHLYPFRQRVYTKDAV